MVNDQKLHYFFSPSLLFSLFFLLPSLLHDSKDHEQHITELSESGTVSAHLSSLNSEGYFWNSVVYKYSLDPEIRCLYTGL